MIIRIIKLLSSTELEKLTNPVLPDLIRRKLRWFEYFLKYTCLSGMKSCLGLIPSPGLFLVSL